MNPISAAPKNTASTPTPEILVQLWQVAKLIDDYVTAQEQQVCACDNHADYEGNVWHDPYCMLGFDPATIALIAAHELDRFIDVTPTSEGPICQTCLGGREATP